MTEATFTQQKYSPSETTWQVRLDSALDTIAYLQDCRERAGEAILRLHEIHPELDQELTGIMLKLYETRIDRDIRRGFDIPNNDVLSSDSTEQKEEHHDVEAQ